MLFLWFLCVHQICKKANHLDQFDLFVSELQIYARRTQKKAKEHNHTWKERETCGPAAVHDHRKEVNLSKP